MTKAQLSSQPPTLCRLVTAAMQVLPSHGSDFNDLLVAAKSVGVDNIPFAGFVLDSRHVASIINRQADADPTNSQTQKNVFVLLKSHTQPLQRSIEYAKNASKQAAFIISELNDSELGLKENAADYDCRILSMPQIREVLGTLIQLSLLPSATLTNLHSASELTAHLPKVIAVTGTNGKTTITQLIAQLCQLSKHPDLKNSAVMGTAGNGRLDHLIQSSHTTGDALAVHTFLRQMGNEHVDVLALEASSHGLDQLRLQGVPIQVAIYTNLSRDHLDYHPDMHDYASAKARLFDKRFFPQLTHAIINLDDDYAPIMMEAASASGLEVWTYSLNPDSQASFVATQINPSLEGAEIHLATDFGTITVDSPLLGRFNVANLIAAIAGVIALGVNIDDLPKLARNLQGASGRMQRVTPSDISTSTTNTHSHNGCFIVDYAHTPDALAQVLDSLKPHCEGRLWAVFGCGGDRDRGKRPLMAQAGLGVADTVILTSDNPRSEDPQLILEDMQQGMTAAQYSKTQVIVDRRDAINYAVKHAADNDIVVIAGKGHETYQEINGVRHDFDDAAVLKQAFSQSVI